MKYEQTIDRTDRKAMIAFLKNHSRYYTVNSWNRSTSYANNVKIYNLGLTEEQEQVAYQLLDPELDTTELELEIQVLLSDFQTDTGYLIGFNGRSSGYLVLYDTAYDLKTKALQVCAGKSLDQEEDFEDEEIWPLEQLQERVDLVCSFDRTCDQVRDLFQSYCNPAYIREETVTVPKTIRYVQREEEIV